MPDPVKQPEAPKPGSPEYVEAMRARAAGSVLVNDDGSKPVAPQAPASPDGAATSQPAAAASVAQKPEGVPDKFWDAEKGVVNYAAWSKSTSELEARFTKQQQGEQPNAAAPTIETPAEQPVTMQTAQAAATAEFQKDGKLSDKSYANFQKLGIDRAMVDAYVSGVQANAAAYRRELDAAAGGAEKLDAMTTWASTALNAQEKAAYNAAVTSGNVDSAKLAIAGLQARYTAEFGKTATGGVNPGSSEQKTTVAAFQTRYEMQTAMNDPRYKRGDPAFHAEVRAKLAASKAQNIDLGLNVIHSGKMK